MLRVRTLFAVLFVGAIVAAGPACGGSGEDEGSLPDGWEEHEAAGFSLALPAEWEGGDTERLIPRVLDEMRAKYPERADVWEVLESSAADVEFLAFDLDDVRAGEEFVTNVNVVRTAIPAGANLREVVEAQIPLLEDQLGAQDAEVEERRVGMLDAVILSYRALILGFDLAQRMYAFADAETGDVFILTFSTGWERRGEKEPTFEEIAATFRLRK